MLPDLLKAFSLILLVRCGIIPKKRLPEYDHLLKFRMPISFLKLPECLLGFFIRDKGLHSLSVEDVHQFEEEVVFRVR